jgi:hypothetical protein
MSAERLGEGRGGIQDADAKKTTLCRILSGQSDQFFEVFFGNLAIPEDLHEKAGSNGVAGVNGYHRRAAIGVLQEMMATLDSDDLKADAAQSLYEFFAAKATEFCHEPRCLRAERQ